MNRVVYYNYIESRLNLLAYRVKQRGKINMLELHVHSETFFSELLNRVFHWHLVNINVIHPNMAGIDLVDRDAKVVAQVSSTCTKEKIESSLSKDVMKQYAGYRFVFVAIAEDAAKLRSKTYENPHQLAFSPQEDIYDMTAILRQIQGMNIREQQALYELIHEELEDPIPLPRVDTNLATIIDILSREAWEENLDSPEINAFEIRRKIEYNDLVSMQPMIDEYKVFTSRLNEKYQEFDRLGANKSRSILHCVRRQYLELSNQLSDSQEIFLTLINRIVAMIQDSKNYTEIPFEELEMCVWILVVDAFIKCKIFKNPEGYQYVIAR